MIYIASVSILWWIVGVFGLFSYFLNGTAGVLHYIVALAFGYGLGSLARYLNDRTDR